MSLKENLDAILDASETNAGMDVIIVSTTSQDQEEYWQKRLEAGRGQICKSDAVILAVYEDWPGGAGNGLGTLYAIAKAALKGKSLGCELLTVLKGGASVGLYHTAGKGTRLAPLPGSEGNNKPAVKLPGVVDISGRKEPVTILEAVIKQTAAFASSRPGRISVFWGDQVFIPSVALPETSTHHIDILAKLGPMPNADTWAANGLSNYGLIAVAGNGDAAQVEKVSHSLAEELISSKVIQVDGGIGVSLGSFSISYEITDALLNEFSGELAAKSCKYDTDPHFWMPLTLDKETYVSTMTGKGEPKEAVDAHFERMQAFLARFRETYPDAGIFGCVNVGTECYWWDYGTITGYLENNLKLLAKDNDEAKAMRKFFGIRDRQAGSHLGPDIIVDDSSILINCDIQDGEITNSVLVGVVSDRVDTDGSVMINVAALDICGNETLLYNVAERLSMQLDDGTVRADAFIPDAGHMPMWTFTNRDGKEDWDEKLTGNGISYDELSKANATAKMADAAVMAEKAFDEITQILTVRV